MASETKLGTAVVPIRAAMDQLEEDLRKAREKCEQAGEQAKDSFEKPFKKSPGPEIPKPKLPDIKWAAIGAGASAAAGVLSDLARAGAEDEASMRAVELAVENAAAQYEETARSIDQTKQALANLQAQDDAAYASWQALTATIARQEAQLASMTGTTKEEAAARRALQKELDANRKKLEEMTEASSESYFTQQALANSIASQEAKLQSMSVSQEEAVAQLSDFIDHMRDTAAIADDQTKPALASLIAVTGDYRKAMELTGLAADLARGKNMSLQTASDLVGKVAQGNTTILKRYGIVLNDNATAEEALAELQKRFAGQAEAYGKTSAGQMEIISLKIGDFRENLGQTIGPAMTVVGLLPGLSAGFSMVGGAVGTALPVLSSIGMLMTGTVIPTIGATVVALGPVLLVLGAVALAAGALYLAYQSNFLGIRDITDSAVGWLKTTIGAALEWISAAWEGNWGGIRDTLSFNWDAMTLGVRVAWTLLSGIVTAGLQVLQGDWGGAWQTIQNTLSSVWDQMASVVQQGVNLIGGFINQLIGAWNALEFTIPGFSVELPGADVPGVGHVGGGNLGWSGVSIGTPDLPMIPTLDTGAIVNHPTLALLAANNQPEAVIPLDRSPAIDYDRLAAAVARGLQGLALEATIDGRRTTAVLRSARARGLT